MSNSVAAASTFLLNTGTPCVLAVVRKFRACGFGTDLTRLGGSDQIKS